MTRNELEDLIRKTLEEFILTPNGSFRVGAPPAGVRADYMTSAALIFAKQAGKTPRVLAEELAAAFRRTSACADIEIGVEGPGYINFILNETALLRLFERFARRRGKNFDFRLGQKIHIEFISANPTGDLHIGHGRGAFYGDILARVLEAAGASVTREYYINDSRESVQIRELGKTALGKGKQYKTTKLEALIGETDFSGMSEADAGFALARKIEKANEYFIEKKLGIRIDRWYSEDGNIRVQQLAEKIIGELRVQGMVIEEEGALWLDTSRGGDDEKRVIVRSDGSNSYFISDIAYHADKFSRGFDSVIDVWGADHHGHVKRMMAVKNMLGWEGDFRIFITQLVSLKENGTSKKMSKRAGTIILLEDLVDELGIDVVRWFFAEKAISTHMDFDLALAREQSAKNPVYYAQYAHARAHSIIKKTEGENMDGRGVIESIKEPAGRALVVKILRFSEVVKDISEDYQVHKLTTYSYELASAFSQFYRDVRIHDRGKVNSGALELVKVAKQTISEALALMGVSAPAEM
ncbi:MAG: arginine--tRNA ligase [Candidatus Yonathbacteria bacterium CG_4_10_14_3_um_filter_47_65]|uniref:Arginine--tRNA ligase n=2 Tax=Parcubacteria group TaxID=1794811 RepID=A0A2M8D7K3_9BACT|nr:MAG: arginine--tRNA ligase [Candidatus Nomurabacteria bacterium CG1_02_47_685]PIP04166.1 MAG: arginine--tRNA ligase [Candidatus Yonathbacteria bacterium CG23_combo_of_CG06-09_8_20_14_all_46_18]PIX56775.1 MAG: arginine--tRNA ligase [Candidatus Yonathbacteria bacterium CG_4_10_14_3_um_filter_47_65]PIY57609.1 MAG: arginine--tRNA ligase [Candidatus Yonathbacteria bacterium CG_4_10_14_0_8_um_filter_47_645]PJB83114.1 MAG: arginine--tRNA ligase [Candidatus Yonathbacteria bacterium CG_4_9_14_0_8_um_